MCNWYYKNRCFSEEDIKPEYFGIIYKASILKGEYSGFYYFGSKQVVGNQTRKLSKKRSNAQYSGKGRKPTKERLLIKKDWFDYCTSSTTVKKIIEEYSRESVRFDIIDFGYSKNDLMYKELNYIIKSDWLSEKSLNLCLKFCIYKTGIK